MRRTRLSSIAALALSLVVGDATIAGARTWIIPHVFETGGVVSASELEGFPLLPYGLNLTKGAVPKTPVAISTTIQFLYVGGLPGVSVPPGVAPEATVDLYLYDSLTSALMEKPDGSVACGPCTFTLSQTIPRTSVPLKEFVTILALRSVPKMGYGVVVVSGPDPDNVQVTSTIAGNAGKGFELSVFGFQPVALQPGP